MSLSSLTRPVFAPLSLIVLFWLEDLFSLRSVSLKQSLLLLSYIIVSDCQLSHVLVNGPTSKRPASDDGLCSGQLLVMWSAVCSGSPHSHVAMSTRPHFFMDALYRQILVRSLFRVVQCFLLRSSPLTPSPGSDTRRCTRVGPDAFHSCFHAAAIHASLDQSPWMTISIS